MFDPFAQRGHNGPGEFSLGASDTDRWERQRDNRPMVDWYSPYTGLPGIPCDKMNDENYKYGYGNSVFIAPGQGTQHFFS